MPSTRDRLATLVRAQSQDATLPELQQIVAAWFFVEWAWIFESYGDTDRIAQFKTSTELAQKFWAGVLVMLGVVIYLSQNFKP